MFRFTQESSSGSYSQSLAKITILVQLCVSIQTLSVLWRHILTWFACVWFTVQRSTSFHSEPYTVLLCTVNHTHAQQILLLQSQYATITLTTSVPTRTVEQDL